MPKKWTKIAEVIDDYATGNNLAVVIDETSEHDDITIFSNTQVHNILSDLYDDFSFRHKDTETASAAFIRQYQNYVANVEDGYARMYDALTRLYNPINNYEMHESGADGHKIGKQTTLNKDNGVSGNARGTENTALAPALTTNTVTDSGNETDAHYTNGFDDSSANGTPAGRDVRTFTERTNTSVVTSQGDGKNNTTFGDVSTAGSADDYMDNTTKQIAATGQHEIVQDFKSGKTTNETTHDKSLSYKDIGWDGTSQSVSIGSDFADGTMHEFTRSGNIGVTTSAQMIQGELDLRKVVLLEQFIEGFIKRYCSYLGDDD